jgi:DNA-binding response OmpR family regulator
MSKLCVSLPKPDRVLVVPVDASKTAGDEKPVPPGAAPRAAASPGPTAPVILVVEDDAALRWMLVRMLGTKYTVFVAADGREALDLLAQIPTVDGIVLDVMLPRLDGLVVGRRVKADHRMARVPILYLSAKNGALDIVAGINAGARHYITKPFLMADLLARLDSSVVHRS